MKGTSIIVLLNEVPLNIKKIMYKQRVITKVILSEITIYNGNDGNETLIFDIKCFLSTKTVDDLETVLANAVQGTIPAIR